jgi:hypothetical protein
MRAGFLKRRKRVNASNNTARRSILRASARQRRLLLLTLARSARWTGNRLDAAERLLRAVEQIVDLELLAALTDN